MHAQELNAELNHSGSQRLLHDPGPARLAYTGPDGFPRVIPIGFLWQDGRVVVCTAVTAPKVAALLAHPSVALTIDTMGPPARALLIRGTADTEIVDGVPQEYIAASAKSLRGAELQGFEAAVRGVYKQMARIAITPSWARFYDFGAGRVPGFLQELTSGS
jgi:Pyridoxamine 5'-phosphate oxidase